MKRTLGMFVLKQEGIFNKGIHDWHQKVFWNQIFFLLPFFLTKPHETNTVSKQLCPCQVVSRGWFLEMKSNVTYNFSMFRVDPSF